MENNLEVLLQKAYDKIQELETTLFNEREQYNLEWDQKVKENTRNYHGRIEAERKAETYKAALEWIIENPFAHKENVLTVVNQALKA